MNLPQIVGIAVSTTLGIVCLIFGLWVFIRVRRLTYYSYQDSGNLSGLTSTNERPAMEIGCAISSLIVSVLLFGIAVAIYFV